MRTEACRGLDAEIAIPPCDQEVLEPEQFQEGGFNTAYIHPPTYYAISRGVAEGLQAIGATDDLFTGGRLAGVLWLFVGLWSSFAAGRLLDVRPWTLVAVLSLVAASPAILMPAGTVNPDTASLAVGGVCLWSVLKWEESPRRRWPLLVLCGVVAEAIKLQNLVVLLAIGGYLVFRAVRREDGAIRVARQPLLALGALAATAGIVAIGWSAVIATLAEIPPDDLPMSQRFLVDAFPAAGLLVPLGSFVTPLADPYLVPPLRSTWTTIFSELTVWLLLLGTLAAALLDRGHARVQAMARSWLLVGLFGGPFLVVLNYVGQGQYIELPVRYALTLVPGLAVIAAAVLDTRVARWTTAAVSAMGVFAIAMLLATS